MNVPANLKYTKSHEWVRAEPDDTVTVGITDHAQDLLGDLVFIDLPEIGAEFAAEQEVAVVESVKAAADVYAPLAGVVTEFNTAVADAPEPVSYTHLDVYKRQGLDRIAPGRMESRSGLYPCLLYTSRCV